MAWTLRAADNFTGSFNASLSTSTPEVGSAWDLLSLDWRIGLNDVTFNGTENPAFAINTTTLQNKQAVRIAAAGANLFYALGIRMSNDGQNGYAAQWRGNIFQDAELYRVDSGVLTVIGSASVTGGQASVGDEIRLEADGTNLALIIRGTTFISYGSATQYASGKSALMSRGQNFSFGDNFEAYDDAGGGGGSSFPFRPTGRLRGFPRALLVR